MTTKLTWHGHATLGLETGGYKLVIDPSIDVNQTAANSTRNVAAIPSTDAVKDNSAIAMGWCSAPRAAAPVGSGCPVPW